MIATLVRYYALALGWLALLVLLVLSPAIGSISSIAAVLAALLLSPVVLFPGSWRALRAQPAVLLLLGVFVALAICFFISQVKPRDVLFAANFFALALAPVVYLVARHRPGARTIAIIGALLVAGALVGALTGSYDVLIQHRARAHGWAQGGNLMARTVVLLGFMALCGVFAVNSRWRWLYLLGPAFALYALYLTGTRGVFIAVPVLGVIALWALMRELHAARRWYLAGGAVVVVAIGLVALVSKRFSALGSLLEHVAVSSSSVTDAATAARLHMWGVGIRVFWKSPWIGSGWANFKSASLPDKIYFFHNDFLDMAVAAGVVGIVAWALTIAAPLIGVFFMPRDRFANLRLYCALILSASLLIFGLTDMTLGYDLPTTLHAFLTAIALGAFREPEPAR